MNEVVFSSQSDEWETPQHIFDDLDREFHFQLDVCATHENHKCDMYFTKEQNGLEKSWGGVYSLLQSPLQRNLGMDGEMLLRIVKAEYSGGDADTCENRYKIFSRLHIPQVGNPVYKRKAEVQRFRVERSVPIYGCNLQSRKKEIKCA